MHYLKPDGTIRDDILFQLKAIGNEKDAATYRKKVANVFGLTEKTPSKESLYYLGGFINGEGSINVALKQHNSSKFGILLDPEFSITQHVKGVSLLFFALCYFKTGRISYKSGSNATMVYRIDNRQSISDQIRPFYKNYMETYCPESMQQRYTTFFELLNSFDRNDHLNLVSFEKVVLPLWESLRVQNTLKTTFHTTKEVMQYVRSLGRG